MGSIEQSTVVFSETTEEICVKHQHNRFSVWKGRDVWHQEIYVQVRLESDGRVFLSTQEGHVSTLRTAEITIEQFHALIRGVTHNPSNHES